MFWGGTRSWVNAPFILSGVYFVYRPAYLGKKSNKENVPSASIRTFTHFCRANQRLIWRASIVWLRKQSNFLKINDFFLVSSAGLHTWEKLLKKMYPPASFEAAPHPFVGGTTVWPGVLLPLVYEYLHNKARLCIYVYVCTCRLCEDGNLFELKEF